MLATDHGAAQETLEQQEQRMEEEAATTMATLSGNTPAASLTPSAAPSSTATTTSASAAAPAATTDSSSTTGSTIAPTGAPILLKILSPSAFAVTRTSMLGEWMSRWSNGSVVGGPSSVATCDLFGSMRAVLEGQALDMLRQIKSDSVQCVVTSPPYWSLRDYHADGQIGQEATVDAYVATLVEVFREVRRVLRADGVCWINLGDAYATSGTRGADKGGAMDGRSVVGARTLGYRGTAAGLKNKDLIGLPWRVAFALQEDGWYLRSEVVWQKPNPMPESVTDRPTRAHEYVFQLTKSAQYHYDHEAVKEPCVSGASDQKKMRESKARIGAKHLVDSDERYAANAKSKVGQKRAVGDGVQRNRRSVWTIATVPFRGAHFATFPPELVEVCLRAGTSPACCEVCYAPRRRVVARRDAPVAPTAREGAWATLADDGAEKARLKRLPGQAWQDWNAANPPQTERWEAGCTCEQLTTACLVLDPFHGAGTTMLVAERLGLDYIGIDINGDYIAMSLSRLTEAREKRITPKRKSA